ncbi:MAG: hypothetical protein IPJ43_06565 [Saprospiraceae bacterium]|nr:hypothetical protein [Saprospiraceae bacterium]
MLVIAKSIQKSFYGMALEYLFDGVNSDKAGNDQCHQLTGNSLSQMDFGLG